MSRIVRAVVGVGLFAVGLFMGGSTWPLAVKALGIGLASTALTPKIKLPETNAATGARLNKSIDPEANCKIIFGETALGTDLRYWEVWGSDQSRIDEVIAAAGHKIQGYGAFYIDDELVTFSGNNATGKYAGALTRITSVEGQPGTVIATLGTGTRWNVAGGEAASMTGVAHYALRWTWTQEKLPRGIPTRITQVGHGALVYDPRRDSTRGGSGSHRADDQSTWQYTPTDSNGVPIGRNPALQMLWYLIGWRVQNPYTGEMVLRCGQGIPLDDIDFASFITAANDCEEHEYYSDCILSTGDQHQTNIAVLESACAGILSDVGGFYSLRIQKDDLDGTLVAFDDGDIVGDVDWQPRDALARRYNQVEGQYVDPDSLYQRRSYPLVRDLAYETADGFRRRTAANYDAVQDPDQAQRLARLQLNQSRVPGVFQAPFNWKAITVKPGQPIRLTLSRLGFSNKLFRVNARKIDPGGAIWLALDEEDPQIYTPGTVLPQPPPEAGAGYDPGFVPTPDGGSWTATGGVIGTPGGVTQPGIAIGSVTLPPGITGVWIEYRRGTSGPWSEHYQGPPESADYTISGLVAGAADYYVSIRYANAFRVFGGDDDRLIIGPLTVGELVSSDTIDVGGRPVSEVLADIDEALEDSDQVARELRREIDLQFSYLISGLARFEEQVSRDGTDSYRRIERVRVVSEGAQATADSILTLTADPGSALITQLNLYEAQFSGATGSGLLTNINSRATITQLNQAVADIFGANVSDFTQIQAEFNATNASIAAVDGKVENPTTGLPSKASISDLNTAEAKADIANARAIRRVEAALGEVLSLFLSSIETRSREDEAFARRTEALRASVGGVSALVAILSEALIDNTDPNNPVAKAVLEILVEATGENPALSRWTTGPGGSLILQVADQQWFGSLGAGGDQVRRVFGVLGGILNVNDQLMIVDDLDSPAVARIIGTDVGPDNLLDWLGPYSARHNPTLANCRWAMTVRGPYIGSQGTNAPNVSIPGSSSPTNSRIIAVHQLDEIDEFNSLFLQSSRLIAQDPPGAGGTTNEHTTFAIVVDFFPSSFSGAAGDYFNPTTVSGASGVERQNFTIAQGHLIRHAAPLITWEDQLSILFARNIKRLGQISTRFHDGKVVLHGHRTGGSSTALSYRIANTTRLEIKPVISQQS